MILAVFITGFFVRGKIQENAIIRVDAFENRYDELKAEGSTIEQTNINARLAVYEEIAALQEEIEIFAAKNSGFAAARAYSISAEIYEEQANWIAAERVWLASAKASGKSYFAPVSYFNAAVAAEEQGNFLAAIEHYSRVLDYGDNFPVVVKAQFSIARLYDYSLNDREAALEAYRKLLGKWPYDPLWANLAQSRIIVLTD